MGGWVGGWEGGISGREGGISGREGGEGGSRGARQQIRITLPSGNMSIDNYSVKGLETDHVCQPSQYISRGQSVSLPRSQ